MKAVITEIRGNTAVLLSRDGCIVKVRNNNFELGQEIEMNKMLKYNLKKVATFAAIAACFVLVFGGSVAAYYTPTTYVSLDVNPSVEYSVNRFNRVISAKGVNDDGTKIIDEIDLNNLKNKSIDEAVALTVDEIAQEGYLDAEGAGIVITTSSDDMNEASEMAENLEKTADETCEKNNCDVVVNAEAVGRVRVVEANKLGVTPGKLNLVEKLKESAQDPDSIDVNEWLNKSVREIMAETKQNKEIEKNAGEDTQNQEQNKNSKTNDGSSSSVDNDSSSAADSSFNSSKGNNSDSSKGNGADSSEDNGSDSSKGNDSGSQKGKSSGSSANNDSSSPKGNGPDSAAGNGKK